MDDSLGSKVNIGKIGVIGIDVEENLLAKLLTRDVYRFWSWPLTYLGMPLDG